MTVSFSTSIRGGVRRHGCQPMDTVFDMIGQLHARWTRFSFGRTELSHLMAIPRPTRSFATSTRLQSLRIEMVHLTNGQTFAFSNANRLVHFDAVRFMLCFVILISGILRSRVRQCSFLTITTMLTATFYKQSNTIPVNRSGSPTLSSEFMTVLLLFPVDVIGQLNEALLQVDVVLFRCQTDEIIADHVLRQRRFQFQENSIVHLLTGLHRQSTCDPIQVTLVLLSGTRSTAMMRTESMALFTRLH